MSEFIENPSGIWVPEDEVIAGATVYCDESGNSGPNYIDAAQPYYVLGGWVVPDARVVDVAVAIEEFRSQHFPQRDELKAAAVLRNDSSKMRCVELFRTLGRMHCVPMFLVAEKRYCVAGKIIETFIDPAYNDVVENPFITDVTTKQELANTLYDSLPDATITEFAEAYRQPTTKGLSNALRQVMKAVEQHVSPELAELVAGCEGHIDEIAEMEAATSPLGDVAGTLNMPCLISFLMLIENLGRLGLVRPIRVIHDQQHAYQAGYQQVFKMHQGMPRLFARLPHSEVAYSNLEHVAKFEMQDSKLSLSIQAADLLAGVVHHCFKSVLNGRELTEGDRALAMMTLPGLLVPEPRLTWLICSGRCIQGLHKSVLKPSVQSLEPGTSPLEVDNRFQTVLAPMFPRNQMEDEANTLRMKVDLPLYGLLGEATNKLMFVNDPDAEDELLGRVLCLFSSMEKAVEFLDMWDEDELNQPQYVAEFGPVQLEHLLDLMEDVSEHCKMMTIDPDGKPPRFTLIADFVDNMRKILDRTKRVFATGVNSVIIKTHPLDDAEVMSLYCHDGKYAAMLPPNGRIYFGKTRDEALNALRTGEQPPPGRN